MAIVRSYNLHEKDENTIELKTNFMLNFFFIIIVQSILISSIYRAYQNEMIVFLSISIFVIILGIVISGFHSKWIFKKNCRQIVYYKKVFNYIISKNNYFIAAIDYIQLIGTKDSKFDIRNTYYLYLVLQSTEKIFLDASSSKNTMNNYAQKISNIINKNVQYEHE